MVTPHPVPPNSLQRICVLVLFSLLWSIQKTNNQKHKAIIIKISPGTSPGPRTHVQEVGGGLRQEGEEKAPHRTPEGSAKSTSGVS